MRNIFQEVMVYFNMNDKKVWFPKVQKGAPKSIVFTNQTTKEVICITVNSNGTLLTDTSTSDSYYELDFEKKRFITGQYDYCIHGLEKELARGICQFNDFDRDDSQKDLEIPIKIYGK